SKAAYRTKARHPVLANDLWRKKLYEHFTLKKRIFYVFVISTILPIVISALISYYAISSIMSNKIHASIESNLRQVQSQLENSISNLNHVSQQMSFQGSVG